MSEGGQRARVVRALRELDAVPIENPIGPGTPDVNYIDGWIELKWLRSWPKRRDTIVRLPHFTQRQKRWLRRRHRRGGDAWLLLQVGKEWLLFTGEVAHNFVGGAPRDELYSLSTRRWSEGLKDEELRECLRYG
ncbi:MAG: hypothetical protein V3S14_03845 [Anaerolineae bacterium]